MTLGGHLDGEVFDDVYCEIAIVGRTLTARRSDDAPFHLDRLIEPGDRYWNGFAERRAGPDNAPN